MKHFSIKHNKGIALILTILLMSLVLFLSLYLLNFTLTEDRISRSQAWGAKTYYLAEAGIQEMVWKLKNDITYKNNFETNPTWTTSFTRTNPFGANNGSYTVTITNSSLAHAIITSTGTINISNGKTSQRVVKTYVYRALGQSGVGNNGGFADGNIDLSASMVNFHDGSAHSNNNFIINGISTVNVDEDLEAVNQYNKSWFSTVNVGGEIHSANYPPAAAAIAMPAVDFDSASPNSLINRATVVYTQNEFDTLMKNNQTLTLNDPITYVDGDIDIKGAQNLIVNGLLVAGRDIIIGHFLCRGFRCGNNTLTVNHTTGQAAGILAKRKINFELWAGDININGAVYANDQLSLLSFPIGFDFDVTGGLIARKLTITSVWQPLNINYDNTILIEVLGATEFSPVITVEHWEEEY
jgi:Tfp pilus assembly protein PilX